MNALFVLLKPWFFEILFFLNKIFKFIDQKLNLTEVFFLSIDSWDNWALNLGMV